MTWKIKYFFVEKSLRKQEEKLKIQNLKSGSDDDAEEEEKFKGKIVEKSLALNNFFVKS